MSASKPMKMIIPLFLLLILLSGTEIACSNKFFNDGTRHGSTNFRSNRDVLIVAGRIKSEFGLSAWVDLLSHKNARRKAADKTFRYNDAPGEFYNMEGKVTHRYGAGYKQHPVRVLVQKQGRGSRVLIDYCINDPSITNMQDYGQSLARRAQRALQ